MFGSESNSSNVLVRYLMGFYFSLYSSDVFHFLYTFVNIKLALLKVCAVLHMFNKLDFWLKSLYSSALTSRAGNTRVGIEMESNTLTGTLMLFNLFEGEFSTVHGLGSL